MRITDSNESQVNAKNENIQSNAVGVVWGAREIGQIIGRTERQAHHLLTCGQIKSAQKKGGRWMAGKAALAREFGL